MATRQSDSNSGVHANVGFDFQRNTCVFIFLEKYNELKSQNYFIMLEHHDDVVFGFMNSNKELSKITTYQAKKSSKTWTTNTLYEIIQKICIAGIDMLADELIKSSDYSQSQYFITNNTISLDYTCSTSKKTKKYLINETNELVNYSALNLDCQTALQKGNSDIQFDTEQLNQFQNLNFSFIDFGRNTKSQLELLTGKFKTVFGNAILDHAAARDTLLYHLKEIESTFNQGAKPRLDDTTKRLESSRINEILEILTTKNLAIEFCRKKSEVICDELNINVIDAMAFQLDFENSLDEFKDLRQGEHQKIIQFIDNKKSIFKNHTNDVACIKELYALFNTELNSTLRQVQLKAAISAGYFLIRTQQ